MAGGLAQTRAPATVNKIHRVLSLCLDYAVKDGRLARNVARGSTCPGCSRLSAAI